MNKFCFFLILLLTAVAGYAQNTVVVLPADASLPEGAKKIGHIKAGNNALRMRCDYEADVQALKEKAQVMHGNLVKITQLASPAFIGKCYRVEADVYQADKLPDYHIPKTEPAPDNSLPHATLFLYRLHDTITFEPVYKVHLDNDSVIYISRPKSAEAINIYQEGTITLWAETEKKTKLMLDVKPGETYYVRCGAKDGELRMQPVLQRVDNATGAHEYKKQWKIKSKYTTIDYLRHVH